VCYAALAVRHLDSLGRRGRRSGEGTRSFTPAVPQRLRSRTPPPPSVRGLPSRQRCLWAGAAALAALAVLACTPRAAAQPSETPAAVVEDQPSAAASTEALATRTPEPTAAPSTAPSISAAPSEVTTV